MGKPLDVIGKRYGRLLVLEMAEPRKSPSGQSMRFVKCQCDCGNIVEKRLSALTSDMTKSCGCLKGKNQKGKRHKGKHNMSGTRIHNAWRGMKARCNYKGHPSYKNYGARGIRVCSEWLNDFPTFYEWAMANGYSDNLTLDRIDVNGNYEPENCRWSDLSTQSANRRSSGSCEYIGVFKEPKGKSYFSRIIHNGEVVFSYRSKSKNECAKKRNEYIIENSLKYPLNEILDNWEAVLK